MYMREIIKYFHEKTFCKSWRTKNGGGNKFDEIQSFVSFLEITGELKKLKALDDFLGYFKYENLEEPIDLEFKNNKYQLTFGDRAYKTLFEKSKNDSFKECRNKGQVEKFNGGFDRGEFMDSFSKGDINFVLKDINKNPAKNIILLVYLENATSVSFNDIDLQKYPLKYCLGWKNLYIFKNDEYIKIY